MHGKRTFSKVIREKTRKPIRIATNITPSQGVVSVGSWIFEETEDGDLQIRHGETGEAIILVSKNSGTE